MRGLFKAPDRDAPRKLRLVKSDRPGFVPPVAPPTLEDLLADLADIGKPDMAGFDMFDIRTDYRNGPLDEVVAGIRETLGAEPPRTIRLRHRLRKRRLPHRRRNRRRGRSRRRALNITCAPNLWSPDLLGRRRLHR